MPFFALHPPRSAPRQPLARLGAGIALVAALALGTAPAQAAATPGKAAPASSQWQGAAFEGDRASLAALAMAGAKVIRVYRESDAWVLDEAHKLGLKVVMGIWLGHPRHGFRLEDDAARAAQERQVSEFVRRYRKHPALLAWGVGNEVETDMPDPAPAWREVDRIAGLVKALDPAHPTLMVVADTSMERLRQLADCCEQVDMLGINIYAGAVFDLPQRLRTAGISKPVVVAELGPLGQWQAGRKPWGAPVELTSSQKAEFFRKALAYLRDQPQIAGVFPFLWGAKQEQTETWHGLLLPDGSQTAMTDALSAAWGKPVATPAPVIRGVGIGRDVFAPGSEVSAGVDAVSAANGPLQTDWKVLAEATDLRLGGDIETAPARIPVKVLQADAASVRFIAPAQPGAYRLFITVRDASGKAATANLPFLVARD